MSEIISNIPVSQNFIPQPIEKESYVMGDGRLPLEILLKDGEDWDKWLPSPETQRKNGVDPNSCPAHGILEAVEAIGKRKYGASFQSNLSERYLSIMSGMKGQGGFPFQVAEYMRLICGAIPEVFLPFDSTITSVKKYFTPSPMSYGLFKIGAHWATKYIFKHEWVFDPNENLLVEEKRRRIIEALKSSPVGVAGYAWSLHRDGKYYNDGPAIHWYILSGYKKNDYMKARDSYSPYDKKLDWNYSFAYAERYSLNKRLGSDNISDEPNSAVIPYLKYLLRWAFNQIR